MKIEVKKLINNLKKKYPMKFKNKEKNQWIVVKDQLINLIKYIQLVNSKKLWIIRKINQTKSKAKWKQILVNFYNHLTITIN